MCGRVCVFECSLSLPKEGKNINEYKAYQVRSILAANVIICGISCRNSKFFVATSLTKSMIGIYLFIYL